MFYLYVVTVIIITSICLLFKYIIYGNTISFDHDGIRTTIISDSNSCSLILTKFIQSKPKIIGIDCEWLGNNKISLLQIANRQCIILIRLHLLSSIPIELIHLLSNVEIIKCGIGIKNDVMKLRSHYDIRTAGCIELNCLYQRIHCDLDRDKASTMMSLNKMYQSIFETNMKYKDINITTSNWESAALNMKQLHYAADDALAGLQIFEHLINKDMDCMQILYGLIDNFECIKCKTITKKKNKKSLLVSSIRSNVLNNVGKKIKFDNCKILQPDGSLLGFCSKYALKWHLEENIADKVDESTIKLKFTKPVKVQIFDDYIRTESPNICFVCGNMDNLRKFSVFPVGYTQYIDEEYYDRSCFNHDSVLLCLFCNRKAQKTEIEFKKLLCIKYKNVTHFELPSKLWYAIKCAKTLNNEARRKQIPIHKQIKLLKQVLAYFKLTFKVRYDLEIKSIEEQIVCGFLRRYNITTKQILEKCLSFYYNKNEIALKELVETENGENIKNLINKLAPFNQKQQLKLHCEELVSQFYCKEAEFAEMWRQNFISIMKPQFLPNNW